VRRCAVPRPDADAAVGRAQLDRRAAAVQRPSSAAPRLVGDVEFSSAETLMPPLVHDADRSAFAFSGSDQRHAAVGRPQEMLSVPTDARSMVTPPLVDRASTPPVRPCR
jgi:hypothetical protein